MIWWPPRTFSINSSCYVPSPDAGKHQAFDPFGLKGALKDTVEGLMDRKGWGGGRCWKVNQVGGVEGRLKNLFVFNSGLVEFISTIFWGSNCLRYPGIIWVFELNS